MSAMNDSFSEWLARLQVRDDAAAREVLQRFTSRLIALAQQRFGAAFNGKIDPEDVVQSAYKSFFRRFEEGKLELVNWNSLWGLLTVITLRKGAARVAYYRTESRDATREVPTPPDLREWTSSLKAFDREPTPLEAILLNETVEQLFAGLTEEERSIVELSMQGYSTQEISQRLGRAERTVRRVRERIRHRLERMQQDSV
jgi:RNA polymerase sigma-70 factor (ECF subfamily)